MRIFPIFLFFFSCLSLKANNIQVSNLSLQDENRLDGYVTVKFDLTWENSWRLSTGASNWDAAWVFVKFRVGNGEWKHAKLHNDGYSTGSGTPAAMTIGLLNDDTAFDAVTNPCVGAFVFRSEASSGTFTNTGIKLRWNYGANDIGDGVSIDVKVFAIEMVYVAQGAFTVGGGGGTNGFSTTHINTSNTESSPYPTTDGYFGGYPLGQTAPYISAWPNGFDASYCMKYEISQQQFVDFLNTLTQLQANNLIAGVIVGGRCNISGLSPGSYVTTLPFVACPLYWTSGLAYADWACLRPMTELEFEKYCRGTQSAVNSEYAWGTTGIANEAYSLSNTGSSDEAILGNYAVTTGNACYSSTNSSINGPMRVGIFAANNSNTGRITSGSSYWGIMELSGNLRESCITIGDASGRAFTGVHGDGTLEVNGFGNVSQWPYSSDLSGTICRGGSFNDPVFRLQVADRYSADNHISGYTGFRAVRGL
jgi:hypothetical protein